MALLLATFMFFSGAPSPARDLSVTRQSRAQVRQYIKNIQHNRATTLNLWALAEVGRDKPEIRTYTRTYLRRQSSTKPIFSTFQDTSLSYPGRLQRLAFRAQSSLLLVACLLTIHDQHQRQKIADQYARRIGYPASNKIHYAAIIQALVNGRPITTRMLPSFPFQPVHFFLLVQYRPAKTHGFTNQYLTNITKQWHISGPNSLHQTLKLIALYHSFYATYHYKPTARYYRSITEDIFFPNSSLKLTLLRSLDYSMYRLGYYNRSLELIRNHSLPLAHYLGDERTTLKLRIAKASYLYYLGKTKASKNAYLRLLSDSSVVDKKYISKARLHNNLATDYWKSGAFDKYLNIEFHALQEVHKGGTYSSQFTILKNLFTHYRINKDFISAREYLSRAKKVAAKEKNKKDLARASFYEGLLYRDLESNYSRALAAFNHALSLISTENYYDFYQNILFKKGKLLEKQKKYHQAQTIYQRALANAKTSDDPRNLLYASFNKANTWLELNKIDSARVMLDTLQHHSLDPLDFYRLVKARTVQARYQAKTGSPKQGIRRLQPVISQILQRSRSSGDIETGFWQVEPEYLDAFQLYANLLIKTHQPARAVEALDHLKTINDAGLYNSSLVRAKMLNEKQLSQYKRLKAQLDELRRQLLTVSKSQKRVLQQQIDELSAQKSALDQKARSGHRRKPVPVHRIQRRLDAHTRVLHITELNDMYYIATISRTAVHFKKIAIMPALRAQLKHSIKQLATGKPNMNQLYRFTKLLGLNDFPSQVQKLIVIPDSYLYQLPLEVLPLKPPDGPHSYGSVHYLIERYNTRYMTSLSDFNQRKVAAKYTYGFAGYGVSQFGKDRPNLQPLPDAQTEVTSVAQQLTSLKHKKVFLNKDATKRTFELTAPHARVLHLATHSMVNNTNPLFSTLYFKRSADSSHTKASGRIFAYQLFDLNFSNEMVMLNSCESGSGAYLQGTGVVGISRALRYAGAQSLVLNLWSVNDMFASDMATHFYHYIDKGESKSASLRNAKLYFLENKNANPHYWGSYMLLGNDEAIITPYKKANRYFAASFMIFFFSLSLASAYLSVHKERTTS